MGAGVESTWYTVLDVLAKEPKRKVTLEMIAEWIMLELRIERVLAEAREALSDLVRRGLVERSTVPAGQADSPYDAASGKTVLYRVNGDRLDEVRRILEERVSSGEEASS